MKMWRSSMLAMGLVMLYAGYAGEASAPVLMPEAAALRGETSLRAIPTPEEPDSVTRFFETHGMSSPAPPVFDAEAAALWVDSLMATLTRDEKIGQLFIVDLPVRGRDRLREAEALTAVRAYGVGGFLVRRLMPPRAVSEAARRLQRAAAVPLFFAADYERGVGRFDNALTELPSNMALGATRDTLLAAVAGRLTAVESRAVGVNLLFAPVVDVNNNAGNPIINIRSYGEDPDLVARMAGAFVREAEAAGVLTTLKHFPGHGNTSVDSHTRMGVVGGDAGALGRVELRPYRVLVARSHPAAGVMSAHLWTPAFDREPTPATFSRRVLHDLLRDSLGFEGFVVTDDVKMGALRGTYPLAERVVRPLEAGADVILTPEDLPAAIRAVKDALRTGRLAGADLDASVRRILRAKARAGLYAGPPVGASALDTLLARPYGAPVARAVAERAVTLLRTAPALPLTPERRVALVQLSNYRGSESIAAAMDAFADTLAPAYVVRERFEREPTAAESSKTLAAAKTADVVVVALYLRLRSGRGKAGLSEGQERFVRRLLALEAPVVLVVFGNPYAVTAFADADAHLVAYDQTLATVTAAARVLHGALRPAGRLPITVDPYPFGAGLDGLDVFSR
ncbi:glycoside hydrolase family 3 protein [Rhodocaloribacter sp.]